MLDSPEGQLEDYLERLCNLMRSQGRGPAAACGLQPAQMEALRYLARCNRYSNTPLAVAEYLGTTKGTVSQTLKVLEAKGLVTKVGDPKDRRMVHLVPTDQGLEILHQARRDSVPQGSLEASGGPDLSALVTGLRRLLRALQTANGLRSFGACASCRFNHRTLEGIRCGLTGESLAECELGQICREHAEPV
jgi:DNA-binding MarR family transcriptional regulator